MKGHCIKHISAVTAAIVFLSQTVLPAAAYYDDGYYDGEFGWKENQPELLADGSYDLESPYMILEVMYEQGDLTPAKATEIITEEPDILYNPFRDPDNPAYFTAGPDITWKVENHTLTFTGSGRMYDAEDNISNWSIFNQAIFNVVFDDDIEYIASYALTSFGNMEKLHLPENLVALGNSCFESCYKLHELDFPESLSVIGDYAFEGCSLESVVLGSNVTEIGYEAFSNNGPLSTVVLPDSLVSLGAFCFMGDMNLVDCKVPDSVTDLGRGIFNGCHQWLINQSQNNDFLVLGDGYLYGHFIHDPTELTIPEGVKHITEDSFTEYYLSSDYYDEPVFQHSKKSRYLTKITLPESLEDIRYSGMANLNRLETVVFKGSNLKSIADHAFYNDNALISINLPDSLEYIGANAFETCSALEKLTIPKSVTYIGENAFRFTPFFELNPDDFIILADGILYYYKGDDKVIMIPDGVKTINKYAIADHPVVSITMPESLRTIQQYAIHCEDLAEVYLNDGLETIEDFGIVAGTGLKTLYIPESLKNFTASSIPRANLKYITGDSEAAQLFSEEYSAPIAEDPSEYEKTGPDNTLDIEKDCWSFANVAQSFDNTYYFTEHDAAVIRDLPARDSLLDRESWTGACFGMTATVILAKAGVIKPQQIQKDADSIHTLKPDKPVQSLINYYHNVQNLRSFTLSNLPKSMVSRMYSIIHTAEHVKDGELPFMVSFQKKDFGHALIGFGQEDGEWTFNDNKYDGRIIAWDPNFPNVLNEESYIYYDKHTFDYCIPHYDVYYSFDEDTDSTGQILYMCNDLDKLNPIPYQFEVSKSIDPVRGDLNNDNIVDVSDAVLLARHFAEDQTAQIPASALLLADVNQDGELKPDDVIGILRIIAKLDVA